LGNRTIPVPTPLEYISIDRIIATMPEKELLQDFLDMRIYTESICKPLMAEDYSVQPVEFVSPPKWHLAHTTWFWEEFVLAKYAQNYKRYNDRYAYLFNSYYNNMGDRVDRQMRGINSRPVIEDIYAYRAYVNDEMTLFLENKKDNLELMDLIEIGIHHEQQHQELLYYDIKFILGHQPFYPAYGDGYEMQSVSKKAEWINIPAGLYDIGHNGNGFCFDNELGRHKQFLNDYSINSEVVSNGEFLEFINDGGYKNHNLWHDEGLAWVKSNQIDSPMYWKEQDGVWLEYDLHGSRKLKTEEAVRHVSFYEAFAYAEWKGMRLPTEFEWEIAAPQLHKGHTWEWTYSAYLPYPNFQKAPGALGEYNGKFMVNQMVLRGSSRVTSPNHSRDTYRNFFHPSMRWQYSGIRLVQK